MQTLFGIIIIFVSALILIKAVNLFISSASRISSALGITGYTVSFLLIAASTSMPEAFVGIASAIDKNPILSFGNVIGANVALLTLVISVPVLLKKEISTRSIVHSKDLYLTAGIVGAPLLLSLDGTLSRLDGIILLAIYFSYIFYVIKRTHKYETIIEGLEDKKFWKYFGLFALSFALVLVASEGIVQSAKILSTNLGWGLGFVGLSITAIGTTFPELSYAITAITKNKQQEILGAIMGSVIANSTMVLGIVSLIHPIDIRGLGPGPGIILFMVAALLIFLRAAKTKDILSKNEAGLLLGIYILFLIAGYLTQS
jgi:cation:H+ antiporter